MRFSLIGYQPIEKWIDAPHLYLDYLPFFLLLTTFEQGYHGLQSVYRTYVCTYHYATVEYLPYCV